MKKVVFNSKYAISKYDEETEIYYLIYLYETNNMLNKEWVVFVNNIINNIENIKPKFIIDDNRERYYAYPPDEQEWILSKSIESWNKIGLKKYVRIVSQDLIGKISGEQILDLANAKFNANFEIKFVENMESALKWINN